MSTRKSASELVGLNTKWYRYQRKWTQENLADVTSFKMAYISTIETGDANLTCKNVDNLARAFKIPPALLFNEETADKAKTLPARVDMY